MQEEGEEEELTISESSNGLYALPGELPELVALLSPENDNPSRLDVERRRSVLDSLVHEILDLGLSDSSGQGVGENVDGSSTDDGGEEGSVGGGHGGGRS